MTKYKIEITRLVENKNYNEQAKAYNERQRYGHYGDQGSMPEPYHQDKALSVDLTEDEFKEIKKAVMGVM